MTQWRFLVSILMIAFIASMIGVDSVTAADSEPGSMAAPLIKGDRLKVDLSLVIAWDYDGDQKGEDGLGYAVSTAGDVNGDGYDDVIVGAPVYSDTVYAEGVAFVFYGSEQGLSDAPDWKFGGGQRGARFGAAVGAAGDVNGDGCDDAIVGAPLHDVGERETGRDAGRAYVFYGCSAGGGLSTTPDWILEGEGREAHFGVSLDTAGDVNGDGYDDIVVGAPGYTADDGKVGRAYVFLGFDSGQTTTLFWVADGDQTGALFGQSVSAAGDVNGDGYGDIIVGVPRYDNDEVDEGAAFVFFGSESAISASCWMTESNRTNAEFGASVGTAGDVNGDGYADVIVGAPAYTVTLRSEGAAFAYYGSAAGLGGTGDWRIAGGQQEAHLGASVGTAGDVNGDGYDEVIVGAPFYSVSQAAQQGMALAFSGSETGLGTQIYWSADGGQARARFAESAGTAGDVNNDGYADVIVGAPGHMRQRTIYGRAYVYRGAKDPPPPLDIPIYLPSVLQASS